MIGVSRLEIPEAQLRQLPLCFRVIYFKDLPKRHEQPEPFRTLRNGSVAVASMTNEKPVSRTWDE